MGIKISNLPVASESKTNDIIPIVQEGETKQIEQAVLLQNVNNNISGLNNEIDRLDNKIDEAVAEFTAPLSYKGEVQTIADLPSGATPGDIYNVISLNKNYIWNGTEWVVYADTIDFTGIENQIKTTEETEEAEEHTIQNTAPVNGKINVTDGKSEQATRSGKNLLNFPINLTTTDGAGITFLIENTILKISGTATTSIGTTINLLSNHTIQSGDYLHIKSSGTGLAGYMQIALMFSDETSYITGTIGTRIQNLDDYIGKTITGVRFYHNSSYEGTFDLSFMVINGISTATDYEQYGVSPSPDYPSEIHNVGDNVNLLDKDTINISTNSFDTVTLNSDLEIGNYIFSGKDIVADGRFNLYGIDESNNQEVILSDKLTKAIPNGYTFTTTKKYVSLRIFTNVALSGNIKLAKGNTLYPYSASNCGNANIEVSNKNLFDISKTIYGYTISAETGLIISASYNACGENYIKVKPNTQYIFSANNSIHNIRLSEYAKDKSHIQRDAETNKTKIIITTTANTYYIRWSLNYDQVTTITEQVLNNLNLQIEEGSTATSYVPHQEQLITFPFTEGQRMYLGDYLASDGTHHTQKEKTYIGSDTEGWALQSINSNGIANFYVGISDYSGRTENLALTNYFKAQNTPIGQTTEEGFYLVSAKTLYIRIKSTTASTVAEFKTWLSTHNLIIQYELATEEIEAYTSEQQEAYYELQHALMYEGLTYVDCIDEVKAKTKVEYYYDNDLNNSYAKRLDNILDLFYPVGSIYMSVNEIYPGAIYGGSWVKWAEGRVPIGVETNDQDFETVEKTGGEKNHVLTVDEMPSHTHILENGDNNIIADGSTGEGANVDASGQGYVQTKIANTGGGQAHNNLQPYITCYFWKRIS